MKRLCIAAVLQKDYMHVDIMAAFSTSIELMSGAKSLFIIIAVVK